jgi:hypothetical protein
VASPGASAERDVDLVVDWPTPYEEVYVRKPAFACLSLTLVLACGSETTSPTTAPPVAAVTRTVTTSTFQLDGGNPCTGEGVLLTVTETLTLQTSTGVFRYADRLLVTGLGDRGTTYAGLAQETAAIGHAYQDRFTYLLRGSDGSAFSILAVVVFTDGVPRVVLSEFRCR